MRFLKKFLLCVCLLKLIAFSSLANAATNLNYNTASAANSDHYATGWRPYRPDIGRFSSLDPAGSPNGPNRYNYCGSDPVNQSDPSGLDWYTNNKTRRLAWFEGSGPQKGYTWWSESIGGRNILDKDASRWFNYEEDWSRYQIERKAWLENSFHADGSVKFSGLTREEQQLELIKEGGHACCICHVDASYRAQGYSQSDSDWYRSRNMWGSVALTAIVAAPAVPVVVEAATPTVVATTTTATAAATRVAQEAQQLYVETQQTWNNVYDRYQLWIEGGEFAYQIAGLPGSELLGYGTHAANGNNWGPRARGGMRVEQSSLPGGKTGGIGPTLKGQAGVEKSIVNTVARGDTVLGREVTIDTSKARVRVDIVTRTPDGKIRFIDSKNGPSAGLTPNQKVGYPALESEGGIPRGARAKAAGLEPNVPIGPTEVFIENHE